MSARVCIQGLGLHPRGESHHPRTSPQSLGKIRFTCGRLTVNEPTFKLGASKRFADYTYSRNLSHSSREFADVRVPRLNGDGHGDGQEGRFSFEERRFSDAGDVAARNGFREQFRESLIIATFLFSDTAYLGWWYPATTRSWMWISELRSLLHLHVQELLPLDRFDIDEKKWVLADEGGAPPHGCPHVVYDESVHGYGAPEPLVVDLGTVLEMEVVGQTMRGNPLLSARKAAQQLQWDRVMQGLRAFLPLAEFTKRPDAAKGESHEAYVGRTLWVTIAYARETRGNITLSEKDVWIKRNLQLGSLIDGTATKIFSYGALVQVNGTDIWGMIHISNVADGRVSEVSDVFEIGEQVKVILVKSPVPGRLAFSTALLESEPGLMLRDKERVFREAEQTAIALRNKHPEWKQPTEDDEEEKPTTWIHSKPISNLGWLEFQQK